VGILASPNRDERFWGPDAEELTRVLRARRHWPRPRPGCGAWLLLRP